MSDMQQRGASGRAASVAVWASLGLTVVFEAVTVPETQSKSSWSVSPWRQDPYHTAVLLAQFTAPVLAVVILVRLLVRSDGGADRAQQLVRAAGISVAIMGLALVFEWASVFVGPAPSTWPNGTTTQVAGLVVVSLLLLATALLLSRCRYPRGAARRWQHDWLADVVTLVQHVPGLRRWAGPPLVSWLRRHALWVFVAASSAAAAASTAVQAFGEGMTDPLLIVWNFVALTASLLAFCVISNSVVGFIARPPDRAPARQRAETSVIAGCVAVLAAIAFHDPLWAAVGSGSLTSTGLVVLTLGAGVLTALVTAAVLRTRPTGVGARSGPKLGSR